MKLPIIRVFSVIPLLLVISSMFLPTGMTSRQPGPGPAAPQASSATPAAYRSPGDRHKVKVSDSRVAEQIAAQGGRLVSDYGSFKVFEVDSGTADSVQRAGAAIADEDNLILLNAGAIDTSTPQAKALRASSATGGKQMRLVQFAGPIRPEWYAALAATGARIVTYIPNNAYLVYGSGAAMQAVQAFASTNTTVQWDGEYIAAYRIDPAVNSQAFAQARPNLSASGNEQFTIQMVEDPEENLATLALIEGSRLEPIIKQDSVLGYVNVTVALPTQTLNAIADRGDVVSIQQWITPSKLDERQDIIITGNVTGTPAVPTPMDYLAYLAGHGFTFGTPTTFSVNLSDSGIDNATTTPSHFALYTLGDPTNPANSRIIYNRLLGTPNTGSTLQGCDGHGNLNSHIIGGYVPTGGIFAASPHADASGFRYGLGIAPFVKIGSSVIFDPDLFTSPTYQNLESQAYRDGARISSNSWGSRLNTYTADSQQYDALVRDAEPDSGCSLPNCISTPGNQEYVIVFAAGNTGNVGSGANTVGSPSTAKNVITVGAAEDVNPFGGADGCGIGDTGADNANDIISFSSRGPTSDGRTKPDLMAPGTHVTGGAPQSSIVSPTGSGTGAQLACYAGNGVCGGPSSSHFFPLGQQWYTASSGTSHSTPAVAGTAALYRQFFINNGLTPPTPALTKALMLNSARYMTGTLANDTLPSNNQGMGEAGLNSFFGVFTTAHSFHDEVSAEMFTATGQQRTFTGSVGTGAKPFRVTLAWTDPPGPTSGSAFINNLDLEVTAGGNTYKGNVFSGAFSATGGTADTRNNVESVFIPAGVTGAFVVTVKATNIAGDGVPNTGGPLDQDFALVIYNGAEAAAPTSTISGQVVYGGTVTPISNVTMTLTAPSFTTQTTTTDINGNYTFTGVPIGNDYTVTPSKNGDVNGLDLVDASLAARYAAGLDVPTANQRIAADADGDSIVTSFDASLIARYVAGLPGSGIVGSWKFAPTSRAYPALSANQTNQGFAAILVGDTSGSWLAPLAVGGSVRGSRPAVLSLIANPTNAAAPRAAELRESVFAESDRGFVLMEYLAYPRREQNADCYALIECPDQWLSEQLSRTACPFLTSTE
jgi:hypothetical protein